MAITTGKASQARRRSGHISSCGSVLLIELKVLRLLLIEVLARVGGFVFECFDEAVEAYGEEGAEGWAYPVDPMVAREGVQDDTGAKGSHWVEGAAGLYQKGQGCFT